MGFNDKKLLILKVISAYARLAFDRGRIFAHGAGRQGCRKKIRPGAQRRRGDFFSGTCMALTAEEG